MNRIQRSLPLTLLALASCVPPQAGPAAPSPSAEAELNRLEERLLASPALRLRYRIRAEGAFDAELGGELLLAGSDVVRLTASGTFGQQPVRLHLYAADGQMRGGSENRTFEEPAPDQLRTALVLGLTRIGLLHNLARLTGGLAPDRAAGDVREWVVAREVIWLEPMPGASDSPAGFHFAIEVAGERTAEADLWLDARGWPRRRTQRVRFPGGEMLVTEEYEVVGAGPHSEPYSTPEEVDASAATTPPRDTR